MRVVTGGSPLSDVDYSGSLCRLGVRVESVLKTQTISRVSIQQLSVRYGSDDLPDLVPQTENLLKRYKVF